MKTIIIIPARYASTRFPGKPLANIGGMSMIQRVYEQAVKSGVAKKVIVATDDEKIFAHVKGFLGEVVMTSAAHKSGTDRCFDALVKIAENIDVVINLQGDEPFVQPEQLRKLISCFSDPDCKIATLVKKIENNEELENLNVVKVVKDANNYALYFSRSPIPFNREKENTPTYFKHLGLYAYRAETLKDITSLQISSLEIAESLEQLRWLENGYKIKVAETELESIAIDSPADLERAKALYFSG
ncbi:MAG: 8-amino-3,8-dideoxy-manno-octulosonate cytidylyltransferase [Bacteroidia bacterium]|nr:8-amino-3,8-dideoxy-manno-octulosonate cytidylyltransferase [Bacteroidia bacterium]